MVAHMKVPWDCWLLQQYNVLAVKGREEVVVPVTDQNTDVIFLLSKWSLSDVPYDTNLSRLAILTTHVATNDN
jgi:hypothetical protein